VEDAYFLKSREKQEIYSGSKNRTQKSSIVANFKNKKYATLMMNEDIDQSFN
jgi:hypothetical protein